jgi:hypothetical protein
MTSLLYDNWYDFYTYLFSNDLNVSTYRILIKNFIEQKNDAHDGLNILVDFLDDFLDTNKIFRDEKIFKNEIIIEIINILRQFSFDEINIPFKLIMKYYDWNNLFTLLFNNFSVFNTGLPIDFSKEIISNEVNEILHNDDKYIYLLNKFVEYKDFDNQDLEEKFLQNGYDILIAIGLYTPMSIFDQDVFELICFNFIQNGVMIDLDMIFLGVKNENNILVVENRYYKSLMMNGIILHLPSSNELCKTYRARGILLDLITANDDVVGSNFKSSILNKYKSDILKELNEVLVNDLNKIIMNYLYTDDLKSVINFYAEQYGGWQNIQAEFWYGWLDVNTTTYNNSFEIFKYCSHYLEQNFANENDELRPIQKFSDGYFTDYDGSYY